MLLDTKMPLGDGEGRNSELRLVPLCNSHNTNFEKRKKYGAFLLEKKNGNMKYIVTRSKQFIKKKKNKKGSQKSYGFILYCSILPKLN